MQYGMNNYKQSSAAKGKELFITNYLITRNSLSNATKSESSKQLEQLSLKLSL
jgi:DNA adenine methylase